MKPTLDFNWLAKRAGTGLALLLGCFALAVSGPQAHAQDLSDGLVGYWPLDGDLEDKSESDPPAHGVGKTWSGNHQNMPENLADLELADATYVEGKFGQSGKFADSFYVETPLELEDRFDFGAIDDLDEDDPEEEDPDLKGFTVSLWVTVDEFSTNWQCPVAKGEQNQWRIHRRGGERTFTGNGGNGDTPTGVIEAPEDEDGNGTWYHLVLRSDRENDRHDFWVNGTQDATGDGINPEGNVMPMMIGQNPDTGDRTWKGNIDDVAMWNRPLTDDEIVLLWGDGEGTSVETALDPSDPNVSGSKSLTLRDVLPETELPFAINIGNTGDTQPLNISNVTLAGPDMDHFTIVESPTSIGPDSKSAISMTFNGFQELGTFNATVSYTTDDPDPDDKEITVAITALIPNPDGPLAHYPLDDEAGSTDATETTTNQNVGVYDANGGSVTLGGAALAGDGSSMAVSGGGLVRYDSGFPLDEFTISFFFQANDLGGLPADLRTLVGQGEGTPEMALLLAGGDLHWFGEETILFSTSDAPIQVGETYHVAIIYDGTVGTIVLDGAVVASEDVLTPARDGTFYAGAFGSDGALGLDGVLDDIQFYGRTLDLEVEVPFLMDNAGKVLDPFATGQDPDSDQDGLSDKLEVSQYMTDPQNPDTDGDTLTDGDEVARGTNPNSTDTDGDGFGDSGEIANGYDPTDANSPAISEIIDGIEDAVLHYDFNEGSGTGVGNAGTGGPGTLTNAHAGAWVAEGGVGGSGYLNFVEEATAGADAQYVATGLDAGDVNIAEGPYTMVTWVRAENTSGDNMIFGQVEDQNVLHNGIRNAQFHIGHWGNDITGGSVTVGEWQHVAFRYEDGNQAIFVDGVSAQTGADKGGVSVDAEITIGSTRAGDTRFFSGDLDEVQIYNVALTEIEITALYAQSQGGGGGGDPEDLPGVLGYWRFNEGAGETVADSSGNGNDGTIVASEAAWVTDDALGSVYQSGGGSYVDLGTLPVIGTDTDFTWSFWVNASASGMNDIVFGNRYDSSGVDFAPREFIKFTPTKFEWHFNGGGENLPDAPLVEGEWSHNLVVKSGSTLTYYRDGAEVTTGEVSDAPINEQPLYLGGQLSGGNVVENFNGLFDEVAVFGRAISAEEVTEVYNRGLAGQALTSGGDGGGGGDRPSAISDVVSAGDGGTISFSFPEGTTFDVEYSTDLNTWSVIATDVSGNYADSDADRAAAPAGYYRGIAK